MRATLRQHAKTICFLFGLLLVLGFLMYQFVAPRGMFSGLSDDLVVIVPDETAPYTDLNGNPVNLETFKGAPLIINSWATWIPFSQTELLQLSHIAEEYKDKINILAINRMEGTVFIRSYLETFGIADSVLLMVSDPSDHFYTAIQGYAMPETVVYDRNGRLILHTRGTFVASELRALIESLTIKE